MKTIKWSFLAMLVLAVIAVISAPLFVASSDNQAMAEKREALCPKVIQLEEKYKEDFFIEEGHKFHMQRCTKEAVDELRWLLETQQGLNYPDLEKAKTARKLSHAIYGNGIYYHNIVNSLEAAQEFAKDVFLLDKNVATDCLTFALAGIKERKEHAACKGGVCGLPPIKKLSTDEMNYWKIKDFTS